MKLHGSFRPAELGPVEHGSAQIDHRGIQAHQFVLKNGISDSGRCGWKPGSGISAAVDETPFRTSAKDDARWHRPAWNARALRVNPDDEVSLPKPPGPRKSLATTWRAP